MGKKHGWARKGAQLRQVWVLKAPKVELRRRTCQQSVAQVQCENPGEGQLGLFNQSGKAS